MSKMNIVSLLLFLTFFNPMHHPQETPWKITSKKIIYDNPWINLTEIPGDQSIGNPGIYGKVHYKTLPSAFCRWMMS